MVKYLDIRRKLGWLFIIGLVLWSCPLSAMASDETGRVYNLAALIKQYVWDNASQPAEDLRIEFSAKLPSVTLKGEKISYEITRNGKDVLMGDCNFLVRFFDEGVQVAKYQIRVNIEVQETYLTTACVIKRNAIITPADLQVTRRWIRTPSLKAFADAEEVIGKRLVVDLGPDREIKRAMIKEPILVKRGEVVRIVLDHGQMSLLASGVAEEEGTDRQQIRVKNLSSQKVVLARVLSEGLVRVDLF